MGTFLAIVSLCLNVVCFYWILILFQRVNASQRTDITGDPEAIQEQLDEHIERLRQENAQFLFELESRLDKGSETGASHPFGEVLQQEERHPFETSEKENSGGPEQLSALPESLPPDEPTLETAVDVLETSVTAQILHLKEQGLTIDKIAKKLKMGKGEVALMLKLHEKK